MKAIESPQPTAKAAIETQFSSCDSSPAENRKIPDWRSEQYAEGLAAYLTGSAPGGKKTVKGRHQ
jgi:hypothetical protein